MKRNLATLMALAALASGGWLGYRAGQSHPHLFKPAIPALGYRVIFGWDSSNKCVAMWEHTTNYSRWTRLERMERK